MLITLEPDGIFDSKFVYLSILALSSHWYEKKVTKLQRASFWPVKLFWRYAFGSNFEYFFFLFVFFYLFFFSFLFLFLFFLFFPFFSFFFGFFFLPFFNTYVP